MIPELHTILTGDRPTGPLHLGHYIGSLANRVALQNAHKQFVLIADMQALTDNYENPKKIVDAVYQVTLDYLAVGIDSEKTTICLQSSLPALSELTMYYLNLVTVNRLQRNPTVKTEIQQKGFGASVPAGFLMYPVSQAADITAFKATLVPVGEDQLPVIEQTNEIVRSFNRIYTCTVLKEATPLVPSLARLPGIDGKAKMSKSLGNAIFLSDSFDVIAQKVKSMYTDPDHIKITDPGKVEGNTVFAYLDAFDPNTLEVAVLKEQYRQGGLGDMIVKKRLLTILEQFLTPIQKKRKELEKDSGYIFDIIQKGSAHAQQVTQQTLEEVRSVMGIQYFKQ